MKMISGGFRAAVLMGAAASVMVFATGAKAQNSNESWPYATTRQSVAVATTGKSPVLAVVGDISCQPGAEATDEATAEVCTDAPGPLHQHLSVAIPGGHCESD